ncbi:hypothetical protein PISMIDRAFT_683830 [Pisolithus microcarpus 441]|uniref:Uncharacterized protein n=1 Tax=Pisolithus microcarpus 441 TaxID=765257 RepID=A0A0C9Z8S7_9AGAM|nr:hypothetical protein BKA83DRAFT_683830 [Pisolithus microcarpus]KIK18812.1 hypothetical protein PISMIDRAFT_683830 [Pisolithus microcarpus 441]
MIRGTRPGLCCPGLTHWSSLDVLTAKSRLGTCRAAGHLYPLSPGRAWGLIARIVSVRDPDGNAVARRQHSQLAKTSVIPGIHSTLPMGKLRTSVLGQYKSNHQSRATDYEFLLVIYWQMAARVVSISGV